MSVTAHDRTVLRELAQHVAEIAALPIQRQKIRLWEDLNGLRPQRPMVMIDQIPWHEMDVDGELALRCVDDWCRRIETQLRRTLYLWRHMPADRVVAADVSVPIVFRSTGWGLHVKEHTEAVDPLNDVVSHSYDDQLQTDEDLEKLHAPEIEIDHPATDRARQRAGEIFGGILNVRMEGHFPFYSPWDQIVQWRGAQAVLMDLGERPDFMHRTIARLTRAHHTFLDRLEANDLLGPGMTTIHCTGAHTDELPPLTSSPRGVRARQLWTCGMAQIFSAVSPVMHQEFELDYARPWYERFGLVYYGCCEPLHDKVEIIRRSVPRVRKVSMSPWVDEEAGAQRLGRDLVYSRKPSPALLATDSFDPQAVEQHLRQTLDACARHGCPVELILKDISTVRYEPQRLWQWADIARRLVEA